MLARAAFQRELDDHMLRNWGRRLRARWKRAYWLDLCLFLAAVGLLVAGVYQAYLDGNLAAIADLPIFHVFD